MMNFITKNKNWLKKILIFSFWICIWQWLYDRVGRDIYISSPFHVLKTLVQLWKIPDFWKSVLFSAYRVLCGIFLSFLFGIPLGFFSAVNKWIYELFYPFVVAIKSTPVMSFIILALVWLKSSNVPIFICFLMCFPIIWTNMVQGIKSTDQKLLEMANVYRVGYSEILRRIYLPSVRPYLAAACATSLGLGWKVCVAAEVLSLPQNAIGTKLYNAKVYLNSEELFAWTFTVIILSLLLETIFSKWFHFKKNASENRMGNKIS